MTKLAAIAAVGRNLELGKDGDMPWKRALKEDLNFFKEHTVGYPLIMGYRTWLSLPKALPGRLHLVITSHEINHPQVITFRSIEDCLKYIDERDLKPDPVESKPNPDAFVIGGGSVYKALINEYEWMYLTEIDSAFDADTWFPSFNDEDYSREELGSVCENGYHYTHVLYSRKPKQ